MDGDPGTYWSSEFKDGAWLAVDLGAAKKISRVQIQWEAAFAKSFSVQVSTDGKSWTDVYKTDDGKGGISEIKFAAVEARHVRLALHEARYAVGQCGLRNGGLREVKEPALIRKTLFTAILGVSALAGTAASAGQSPNAARTQANVMVEITFRAERDYRDAFHEVALDALFETPQGRTLKVPAFWAGGRTWKVRYVSPVVGRHPWRSVCSVPADRGLHGLTGTVTVENYRGENPLYLHGPLRVAADRRHFEHIDGTPFFWLGDTWWMGLCQRLHWPDEFQQLAADRKLKGFTVIQIVAGLYPDMPAFDQRGANEAGFPWEKDYTHIRPEYFDKADQRFLYLVDQGFVPCIVAPGATIFPGLAPNA